MADFLVVRLLWYYGIAPRISFSSIAIDTETVTVHLKEKAFHCRNLDLLKSYNRLLGSPMD